MVVLTHVAEALRVLQEDPVFPAEVKSACINGGAMTAGEIAAIFAHAWQIALRSVLGHKSLKRKFAKC